MKNEKENAKPGLFDFRGSWWIKALKYRLINGLIMPVIPNPEEWTSGFTFYSPFDYYTEEIDEKIIKSIKRGSATKKDLKNKKPFKIYTLFVSLTDPKEILSWVNKFGLPFVCGREEPGVSNGWSIDGQSFSVHHSKGVSLSAVQDEIECFRLVIDILAARAAKNTDKLKKLLDMAVNNEPLCNISLVPIMYKRQGWDVVFSAGKLIEGVINHHLANTAPRLWIKHRQRAWEWQFDSLLEAMYLMLFLDITCDQVPRRCENPRCNDYFIPRKLSGLYCSDTCQVRTKAQINKGYYERVNGEVVRKSYDI